MEFSEGLAVMLASIIGAGVFALPAFARGLGAYAILFISLGLGFSLALGYTILSFAPGNVEMEKDYGCSEGTMSTFKRLIGWAKSLF